jgi:hypothetical protein
MAIDPDSDTLYLTLGNPTPDFLGTVRHGKKSLHRLDGGARYIRPPMAAPNIFGQRLRRLWPLIAGPVVIGFAGIGSAARAEERNAHDEAVAALADIDFAIGELSKSSDLTTNTEGLYKQAAWRAAAAIARALGHLDWLTGHACLGPAV